MHLIAVIEYVDL